MRRTVVGRVGLVILGNIYCRGCGLVSRRCHGERCGLRHSWVAVELVLIVIDTRAGRTKCDLITMLDGIKAVVRCSGEDNNEGVLP